jgi:hypothetical protein
VVLEGATTVVSTTVDVVVVESSAGLLQAAKTNTSALRMARLRSDPINAG